MVIHRAFGAQGGACRAFHEADIAGMNRWS